MDWVAEIEELHSFFDAWSRGEEADWDRFESVIAPGFTIVDPDGIESDRATITRGVRDARGRGEMAIQTVDHRLVRESGDLLVARYVETQRRGDERTRRVSTVVFGRDEAAPNGLVWVSVHETWQV
ncbi:MAG: DUF4440 domain-containing protein [Acidimicrobiales bacterium]